MNQILTIFAFSLIFTMDSSEAKSAKTRNFHHPFQNKISLNSNDSRRRPAAESKSLMVCPSSFKEWSEWRRQYLLNLYDVRTLAEENSLDSCENLRSQKKFFRNTEFKTCMKPVRTVNTLADALNHGGNESFMFLFEEPNAPLKTDNSRITDLPSELSSDEAILKFTSDSIDSEGSEFKKLVKDTLTALPQGWEAFSFTSKFTSRPGLIFFRQGVDKDQFVHFDREDEPEGIAITTESHDPNGQLNYTPNIYFKTFRRYQSLPSALTNHCILCHRAGIMPIVADPAFPVTVYSDKQYAGGVINWFNKRVAPSNSAATLPNFNSLDTGWPQLGNSMLANRTDSFLDHCSGTTLGVERREAIRNAMNCSSCHDGGVVGKVGYDLDTNNSNGRVIDHLVLEGLMPPDSKLSKDDRSVLLRCLKFEYFGGFKSSKLGGSPEPGTFIQELSKIKCPTARVHSSLKKKKP